MLGVMADAKYPAASRGRSLSRITGTAWVIAGSIATAISLLVLVPMAVQNLRPIGIPGTAIVVVCTLYLGMLIVRRSTPRGRLRACLLAADLLGIVFVTVLTGVLVAGRLAG